jgi:hypothetical protein
MNTPKLMLTILAGGVGLGALLGQMAEPAMKFAEQPDWRERYVPDYSNVSMQFVGSGPEDLTPMAWYGPSYIGPSYRDPVYEAPEDHAFTDDYGPPPADYSSPSAGYALADTELEQPPAPPRVIEASVNAAEVAAVLVAPAPPETAARKAEPGEEL